MLDINHTLRLRKTAGVPTMNVHLTPELEVLVQSKVQSGRYDSASEVVREALRLMEERDRLFELHRDEICKKIAQGLESLQVGKGVDGEAAFNRLDSELDQLDHSGDR
jgi:antitoxin ParD1/3/4